MALTLPGWQAAAGQEFAYGAVTSKSRTTAEEELHGVWISYLDWNEWPKDEENFQKTVDKVMDECALWGMNAVFVHVRSHGDSMYPSSCYPWSKFASGQQGNPLPYDPLAYMIAAAHERGMQFHAWFNPYRITGYQMKWEEVSDKSPAKKWLSDNNAANDRNVLCHQGEYYYNPASEDVKNLVVNGVMEVVNGYDVDGVHFDDYFYPQVDDTKEALWFDKPEYLASGSAQPIAQWRRDQVSDLVKRVYDSIKQKKPGVLFGISPQGYLKNLRSDNKLFVDVDRWMTSDGYVDYIMPQIYWGFEARTSDGSEAPYAFSANLKSWAELKKKGGVRLYLGLGLYRAGTNVKDNNDSSEWLRRNDIIKRQVEEGRENGAVSGYCFYAYRSFREAAAQGEIGNLLPLLK
ncbi:hypothetical protein DXA13_11330 [Clostridium sp. AM58-1XD]|nr:hypothetical protein DXA13_11330 [Clostridium sp. AM58-1XD]